MTWNVSILHRNPWSHIFTGERGREGGRVVGHVTVKIQNGCLDHLRLVALRSIEKVSKPLFQILSKRSILNLTYMLWKTCYWVIDGLNIFSWKKIFLYRRGRIRWCCEIHFKLIWPYWWYWWIKYYEVNVYLLRSI